MNKEEQKAYLLDVARCLGNSWHLDQRREYGFFLMKKDIQLYVSYGGHRQTEKGRFFVSGCLPPGYYRYSEHKISFASSRRPRSVSKDIQKRLVEPFLPELAAAKEYLHKKKLEMQQRENIANLLRGVGFNYRYIRDYSNTFFEISANNKNIELLFKVYGDTGDISLRGLNNEQLIKLGYFIKDL